MRQAAPSLTFSEEHGKAARLSRAGVQGLRDLWLDYDSSYGWDIATPNLLDPISIAAFAAGSRTYRMTHSRTSGRLLVELSG